MRHVSRLITLLTLFLISIPLYAQETTPPAPIDPEADLTETYTMQNITVNYPSGLTVTEADNQLTFGMDEIFSDYFTLTPPQAFESYDVANDTLEITAQSVYEVFAPIFEDTRLYEEAVTETTFAGYDALTFTMSNSGLSNYTYIFDVDGEFFLINLNMQTTLPAEPEIALIERIIGTMVISDVEFTPEPLMTIEPFAELTLEPLITMQSRHTPDTDAVELTQAVSFDDIGISLSLPETWAYDADKLMIATSETSLELFDIGDVVPEGEVVIQFAPPDQVADSGIEDMTVMGVSLFLREMFQNEQILYSYVDLNYEAMYMPLVSDGAPENAFVIVMSVGDAGDIMVVSGITPDFEASEAVIIAILNSVVYEPVGQ